MMERKKGVISGDVCALTRELCELPSTSGSEAKVVSMVSEMLEQAGFHVSKQPVAGGEGRANLLVRCELDSKLEVLLSTHLDTVPPFIAPTLSDDRQWLLGRGVCDAKGIAAAIMLALFELKNLGESRVGGLFLVGEETTSDGAKLAAGGFAPKVRFIINGEPTNLCLAKAMKGAIVFSLTAHGSTGHSAYPETGHSALHQLNKDINALLTHSWPVDEVLGPTTLNIGRFEGGRAANVIADEANAQCVMRTTKDASMLCAEIKKLIAKTTKISIISSYSPTLLHHLDGYGSCTVAFGSDIPFLAALGKPLLIGPGSILDAHTAHERVRVEDLKKAVTIYRTLSQRLLKS